MNKRLVVLILVCFLSQTSCTALVVGGGTAAALAADKRTAGTIIEDENIEIKFIYQFMQDKSLSDGSHVNITSYNGWILLTGQVPNQKIKHGIYNLALTITHVKRVFNEVTIAAPSTLATRGSDTYLTSKIKTQLLADKYASAYNIKVVSENGIVYLMGLVSHELASQAVEIARKTRGVQKVIKLFDYQ